MTKKRLGSVVKMGPKEITERLNFSMVRDGLKRGFSLSALLERMNPTASDDKTGLDAFGRVLQEAEIFVRSDPAAGVVADTWEDAFHEETPRRLLGIEWLTRQWRAASFAQYPRNAIEPTGRRDPSVYTSGDSAIGSWARPYAEASSIRTQQIAPAIPLQTLIAVTTPIDTNVYRAVYIEDIPANQKRMVRVGETGEIPRVTLQTAERDVTLYKYGRAIESSYEVLRRQRLDRVAVQIALMAVQVENDKVDTVMDVIVNGDGNPGTAAPTTNLTTLDPGATANNPRLESWIAAKMLFKNPYHARVLLGQQAAITKAMLINTGTANVPLVVIAQWLGIGGFTVLNQTLGDNVGYGVLDNAPANRWVLIDDRFAIERIYEIGATITEMEKFATKQTEVLVLSEVEGYAKLDKRAAQVVRLDA